MTLGQYTQNIHNRFALDNVLRRIYNHRKVQFVQFIKHISGIEILAYFSETVSKAFDNFIAKHSYLSSRQLQFIDLLRNFILEKGELQKPNLIESPFTLIDLQGIGGEQPSGN